MGKSSAWSSRRRKSRAWVGYLLFFLAGSLVAFWVSSYLNREKPLSSEEYSEKVLLIDRVIESQFSQTGIAQKDILSRQSSVRQEGGIAWKQSTLKIQPPRSLSFRTIEDHFEESLSALGRPVSVKSSQFPESLRIEVKVRDRMTHQITFLSPKASLKGGRRPRIAIVIDDLGSENQFSQEFLRLDLPLTLSILPFTPYSKSLASRAHKSGKEVLLHLPMEPRGYPKIKPGQGALLEEMDEIGLLLQLSRDIEAVPYIKGVSSHMGSHLTEDSEKMKIILSELKRRRLFFLDSRTTPQTVGLRTAKSIGLTAAGRTLFLDHSPDEGSVKREIERLMGIALSQGKAIGIGHPHPSTIKSIQEMIPKMEEKGIEMVLLSALMESKGSGKKDVFSNLKREN